MEKEELYFLVKHYRDNTISNQDLKKLKDYLRSDSSNDLLDLVIFELAEKDPLEWKGKEGNDHLFGSIQGKLNAQNQKKLLDRVKTLNFIRTVAALFALVGSAFLLTKSNWVKELPNDSYTISQDWSKIAPGKSKAKIVLENGQEIDLEDLPANKTLQMDGYSLVKNDQGEISYFIDGESNIRTDLYNTIIVPKGGEYKLNLPDGSQVWLNAASNLKYPINFGKESRKVELTGEAYFHVVKKLAGARKLPFIVLSGEQELEVLGTQFNLNTFSNKIKTTLVEGAVQLRFSGGKQQQLSPNQQAVFNPSSEKLEVENVNTYYSMAWKEGAFAFDNAPLEDVLGSLSRWYNVSFDYNINKKSPHFTGSISRYDSIEKLLELIEITNSVKFEIKGRRIMVSG
ncbi:hypothetical protein CHT99_18140 [Sphingobacterium cellulitidis]|nr:hypothetical protein CHT99_18140 [Sphingobacterium cellulitidis]